MTAKILTGLGLILTGVLSAVVMEDATASIVLVPAGIGYIVTTAQGIEY